MRYKCMAILLAILPLGFIGCEQPTQSPDRHVVTYTRDIAPITFDKCATCHRPHGAAPFSLLTYDETAERAAQIADVVATAYMPPWLPSDSDHEFLGDRRLTSAQIKAFEQWVADGKQRGDEADLPISPTFSSEWTLGEPDLVLEMESPYVRAPSESDTWRNIVLPYRAQKTVYVRAYDFDPGNDKAVHHAVITVDRTGRARELDAGDAPPGFDGMNDGRVQLSAGSRMPDGQTLGWTPGKVAHPGDDDIAWRLDVGSDLVLQLHIPASGKPESIQSRVALYFAERPPTKQPFSIEFALRDIDIAPGESNYERELSYQLPVAVELVGLYPHAHYVCRQMFATATLPDGLTKTLLHIPDWNFDWQDDYRFAQPIALPAGTTLRMKYVYDNSTANIRNPNNPPQRITYGEQSTDSMGDLVIQVIPRIAAERPKLIRDYTIQQFRKSLAKHQKRLEANPNNPRAHIGVGEAYLLLGEYEQAQKYLQSAIQLGDKDPRNYANLAVAYRQQRNFPAFAAAQRQAVELAPANPVFRRDLANALLQMNMLESAAIHYKELLEQDASDVAALSNIGMILGRQGELDQAVVRLEQAIRLAPNFGTAHLNLGVTYRNQKQHAKALKHFQRAAELNPQNPIIPKLIEQTRTSLESN